MLLSLATTLAQTTLLGLISLPALFLSWLAYRQITNHLRYYRGGCNIPCVRERPFIGALRMQWPHVAELENRAKLGNIYHTTRLTEQLIMVSDPDLIHIIVTKENFPKSGIYKKLTTFWGPNLVTLGHGADGPWKEQRTLINPAFKLAALREMTPTFAFHAASFTKKLIEHSQKSPAVAFNVPEEVDKLALDIISSAGFGHNLGAFSGIGEKSPFLVSIRALLTSAASLLLLVPFGPNIKRFLQRKNLDHLDRTFYKVIDKRMAELGEGKQDPNRVPDLLDIMLRPGEDGKQLSREELRNELLIFYFAGHETTATLLCWAIYSLVSHPEVYENVVHEIDSVMGPRDPDNITSPTPAQLDEMPYLTMVINETLRLYPPISNVGRIIPETFEYRGFIFPKGMSIIPNILLTHRDETLWPEPEKFDPERFNKSNSAGRHPLSFIPFSAGNRICVGKNFFYYEVKVLLATMLREVKLTLDDSRESGREVSSAGVLKPNAVWIKASKRIC